MAMTALSNRLKHGHYHFGDNKVITEALQERVLKRLKKKSLVSFETYLHKINKKRYRRFNTAATSWHRWQKMGENCEKCVASFI